MFYINMILFIISIICLLISLFILVKSIHVAIMRFIKIKSINMGEVKYKDTNTALFTMEIEDKSATLCMWNQDDDIHLTLIDSYSEKVIASIKQFPCIVGRGLPADVIIASDRAISKRHVVFTYENGKLFVSDLQSTNGTLINGDRISSKCEVKNGNIMKIGRTQIKLVVNS